MFYGVINETCNNIDCLEIELENSLLFFKSLDVIQESGIQIVQEGAWETIKGKISELWEKFTRWIKSIWEKIKAIFTKSENTVKEIKETNDKIQKGETKEVKNESSSYIKEDSEGSGSKEIKWYERNTKSGSDEIIDKYLSKLAETSFDAFLLKHGITGYVKEIPDSVFDDYADMCKRYKESVSNSEVINQLFIENTFTDVNDVNQVKKTADKIEKASEQFDDDIKDARSTMEWFEDNISKVKKGVDELKKNNITADNMITDYNGRIMTINNFDKKFSCFLSCLHVGVNFLAKYESANIKHLNSNKAAIKRMYNFLFLGEDISDNNN